MLTRKFSIIYILLAIFVFTKAYGYSEEAKKADNKQVQKVALSINVNKIYEINELNETYIIDGYLVASWLDRELAEKIKNGLETPDLYENKAVDEKIKKGLWVPALEFINIVGQSTVANKKVIINDSGEVTYNERFQATFSTAMDFKKFPFDNQTLSIQLESFSYNLEKFQFINPKAYPELTHQNMLAEWDIVDKKVYLNMQDYSHLNDDGSAVLFSRYNLEIDLERKYKYYLWTFMLPLFLIIASSWSIFWIDNFDSQLSISFMLMLTVVAFNFQASSLLPKLPYTTFMGSLTVLGYLSIFTSLIVVLAGDVISRKSEQFDNKKLLYQCRFLFPLFFILIILLQIFTHM